MGTTPHHRFLRNTPTLWIVAAMLGVAAILLALLPHAPPDRGRAATPTLITSL
jgi:hypothetical protein